MKNVGDSQDIPGPSRPGASSAGRRLGLLGGTFDPPHVGHVAAAVAVGHALALDAVWLVVANRPWQKVGERPVSPAEDRWAMVRAAVEGVPGVEASRVEIDRGGDSFTADTLAELTQAEPEGRRFLIVGADAAAGLATWSRPDEVRAGADLVVVTRPGLSAPSPPDGWWYETVVMPRLDVSSTDLRVRAAAGAPIDGLVPPAVCAVIRERRLYGGPQV